MKKFFLFLIIVLSLIIIIKPAQAECYLDADCDGWLDIIDNCPNTYNPDQKDSNSNGIGDACDAELICDFSQPCANGLDSDCDGWLDIIDNCLYDYNPLQEDSNSNGFGDVCDPLLVGNNSCTAKLACSNGLDSDCDGWLDIIDNCPYTYNPLQEDSNGNGIGDACETPNKAPELIQNIPKQTWNEDTTHTINLSNYFYDPNDDILTYTFTNLININLNLNNNILTLTPNKDWYGTETLIITASDGELTVTSNPVILEVLNINDPPEWVMNIPAANLAEDFGMIVHVADLTAYAADPENDPLSFTVTSGTGVMCTIRGTRLEISSTQDWHGTTNCTVTVSDGEYNEDNTFSIIVSPVNDAPIVSNIPDQTIIQGETFASINLNSYVTDVDNLDSEIVWTVQGNNQITVFIDSNNIAELYYPLGWQGSETLNFTATDPEGASDYDLMVATVILPPLPPVVKITEPENNEKFAANKSIKFIAMASDPNNDSLTYFWDFGDGNNANTRTATNKYDSTGEYNVKVIVSDGVFNVQDEINITIYEHSYQIIELNSYKDNQFSKQESNFLRGEPLYLGFKVKDLQGIPVSGMIVNVKISNNDTGMGDLNLNPYNGLIANQKEDVMVINGEPATLNGNYYYYLPSIPLGDELLGTSFILTIVYDNAQGADHEYLEVSILNNPVQLSTLPNVRFKTNETGSFPSSLDAYINDVETEDEDIIWTVIGNNNIDVNINSLTREVLFSTDKNWTGSELITFTADDTDGSTASKAANITALSAVEINNAPVWTASIPNATLQEDFGMIVHVADLTAYAADPESDPLSFTVNSGTGVMCSIRGTSLEISSVRDWFGNTTCTVTAQDDKSAFSAPQRFSIEVLPVNDAPVLMFIPDMTATEGNLFSYTALCIDVDSPVLTYSDDTHLFNITNTGLMSFTPTLNDTGNHFITVTCSDGLLSDSESFNLFIDSSPRAPVIYPEPLTATIGELFTYTVKATDLNNDILTFSDNSNLFNIDPSTGTITFTPTKDMFGTHHFAITVTDNTFIVSEDFVMKIIFKEVPQINISDDGTGTKGVVITDLNFFGSDYNSGMSGDYMLVSAVLRSDLDSTIRNLKVGFIVPELGINQNFAVVDLEPDRRKTVGGTIYLPNNIEPGEYYFGLYIYSGSYKKTRYLPVMIY